MLFQWNVSRTWKSQLGSEIILPLTALPLPPFTAILVLEGQSEVQHPGPRADPLGGGSHYPSLNANEQCFFNQAFAGFQEVGSVSRGIAAETGSGWD
jgi:hypothetical protein